MPENLFNSLSTDDHIFWHPELQLEYISQTNSYQKNLMKQKIRK